MRLPYVVPSFRPTYYMNHLDQFQILVSIATQSKKLLLSDDIVDATPEVMDLCELVERYEETYGELAPYLKPQGVKPWYSSYYKKG